MHLVSVRRKSDADSPSHCVSTIFERMRLEKGGVLALDGWLDVLCSGKAMRVFIGVHQGVNGL